MAVVTTNTVITQLGTIRVLVILALRVLRVLVAIFIIPRCHLILGTTDIDECSRGIYFCGTHSQCNNIIGGYTCNCSQGFAGSFNCEGALILI